MLGALQVLTALEMSSQAQKRFRSEQGSRAASSLAPSAEYDYFDGIPDSFVRCCDVLLKLDDGVELPAHSQTLARFSKVCASMLDDDGPLSSASASKKALLPLTDCSRATAIGLMSVLYSTHQYDCLRKNRESCMGIAKLAHKLDMEVSFWAIGTSSNTVA